MARFRKVLLAFGFSLLFIYLQLQFELKASSSPSANPLERRANVREEALMQPSQVIEALLTVPPIIQLPPGWSETSADFPSSGRGALILTLPKDGALG